MAHKTVGTDCAADPSSDGGGHRAMYNILYYKDERLVMDMVIV